MPRIVSVWLPAWPMERLARTRRRAGLTLPCTHADGREQPFALVESGKHGLRLTAVNAPAWREGLRPGLPLADARAALPALQTAPAEPDHDRAALAALAAWAGRYGPARNIEGGDGLWIDTSGVAHLFGGEMPMLADLLARLARAGLTARTGLADTAGGAFALARFAATPSHPARIAGGGMLREALAPLPVGALRLPADTILLLQRLGLRRIGQLYDVPREALAQRFRAAPGSRGGKTSKTRERQAALLAGSVLARLDQALGRAAEPRLALAEPPRHLARRLFAEPLVTANGVTAALEALAHDIAHLLEAQGEGGTRFTLDVFRADGSTQQVCIGASRACRDPRHLVALFSARLDTLDAGFGVDAMTLAATEVEPLDARQIDLAGSGIADCGAATGALIDRLSSRLGAARVVRLTPCDSHIPERAQRRTCVLASPSSPPAVNSTLHIIRPPLLLPMPEPIAVLAEVPEGPPLRFTWRRLVHRIVRAQGPERIEPEWWRAIGNAALSNGTFRSLHLSRPRDYYRVEDEHGGRYWLFRAGLYGRSETECNESETDEPADDEDASAYASSNPVWFIHGMFG